MSGKGKLKDEVTEEIFAANHRRIVIAQSLYAFGAFLCIIHTYVSIGLIDFDAEEASL